MDRHKFVSKGYHGTRRLDREELNQLYHNKKVRPHSKRYHWIDTLFALCEVTSYASIVTALEQRHVPFDARKLFTDVRESIDQAHAEGAVYDTVRAAMDQYIELDPALPQTLHKLRSAGKRLFLLTNSPYHYTADVMSYLLDGQSAHYEKWEQYFDVIICSAKKPRWFKEGTPLLVRREDGAPAEPATTLEKGRIYEGGSIAEFEAHLQVEGGRVLYVGDHIYGDILRSKKDTTWRTAMIIQELDQELEALLQTSALRARRRQLHEARPMFEDELRFYSAKFKQASRNGQESDRLLADRARSHVDRVRNELSHLEQEYKALGESLDNAFHPYFGSLLKEMNGLSLFGQQIELYADIYMRRVSSLGAYSPMQFFRSPHDLMPHEL
jgi:HAD superfamily 5'-nucleotidase-like hydrolase